VLAKAADLASSVLAGATMLDAAYGTVRRR
jgi:hypothetical protein